MAGKIAKSTGGLVPGEIIPAEGDIEINVGAREVTLVVANTGDRPIQVGSHYHFFETNEGLSFDRQKARACASTSLQGRRSASSPARAARSGWCRSPARARPTASAAT